VAHRSPLSDITPFIGGGTPSVSLRPRFPALSEPFDLVGGRHGAFGGWGRGAGSRPISPNGTWPGGPGRRATPGPRHRPRLAGASARTARRTGPWPFGAPSPDPLKACARARPPRTTRRRVPPPPPPEERGRPRPAPPGP